MCVPCKVFILIKYICIVISVIYIYYPFIVNHIHKMFNRYIFRCHI